ncbi:hypothetical protein BDV09DRAFT_195921 [Aspergillus tetrazonus]
MKSSTIALLSMLSHGMALPAPQATEDQAPILDAPTTCSSNPGTAVFPSMPGYPGFMGGWPGVLGTAPPSGTYGNSGFYGFPGFGGFDGSHSMLGGGGGAPTGSITAGPAAASSPGFGGFPGFSGFPGFGGSSGFSGFPGFGGFPGSGGFPNFFGGSLNPSTATQGGVSHNACTPVPHPLTKGEDLEDGPENAKADAPQSTPKDDRPADNPDKAEVIDGTIEHIDAPQAATAAAVPSPTPAT